MSNLSKRIFTSIILLSILLTSFLYNKYTFLLLLIIASIISYSEFSDLAAKIWKKRKPKIYLINFITLCYLIFFTYSSYKFELNIILILFVCISSDIGGYVIGKTIGGKKLTKISPNKTISGSVGSFVFSLTPLIYYFYNDVSSIDFYLFFKMVIYFLLISLVCQIGDLFISYFKRKAGVKDTGTILPGHGGLLDRIDGIIFAVPFAYIFETILF